MTANPSPTGDRPAGGDQRDLGAGLTARFLIAVGQEVGGGTLTPAALARAVVRVLPVDGAGLSSMVDALRLPLGATSDDAARAEELQTSLGEGPCLEAAQAQASIVADRDDLVARWPLYAEELEAQTPPYRAVASVPLETPGRGVFAALDLYATDPALRGRLDLDEVDQVAVHTAALLTTCLEEVRDIETREARPSWYEAAAGRRHDVWVAIGMVMASRTGRRRDALSLLRAHAYTQNRSLDDLAADVVEGRVPLTDLTD